MLDPKEKEKRKKKKEKKKTTCIMLVLSSKLEVGALPTYCQKNKNVTYATNYERALTIAISVPTGNYQLYRIFRIY